MKLFIGSSSEAQDQMRLVASWIEKAGHTAVCWDDTTVLPPSEYPLSSLHKLTRDVDGAVFVLTEDDSARVRGSLTALPRDNVLIEYGLFLGALGLNRVVFVRVGQPKVASDLAGLTYIDLTRQNQAQLQLKQWLNSFGQPEVRGRSREAYPAKFWGLLSTTVIILFGADPPRHREPEAITHPKVSLSPNDLHAAFMLSNFLSRHYPEKEVITWPAQDEGWKGIIPSNADLILIGGFISNTEFLRQRRDLERRLRIKMGRACSVTDQMVYHPSFDTQSYGVEAPSRKSPQAIDDFSTEFVSEDHAIIRSIALRLYGRNRRVISIAGIKGTGTLAGATYLTTDPSLDVALPAIISGDAGLEFLVSGQFNRGKVEKVYSSEVYLNGEPIPVSPQVLIEKCELGRTCEGCDFGLKLRPSPRSFEHFQAIIFDLDDTLVDTYDTLIVPLEIEAAQVMLNIQPNLGEKKAVRPETLERYLLKLRRTNPSHVEEELRRRFPQVNSAALEARRQVDKESKTRSVHDLQRETVPPTAAIANFR